jgi:hypothetical protein
VEVNGTLENPKQCMALPWRQFALFFIIEMRAEERTLQSIRQGPLLLLYLEATGENLWEANITRRYTDERNLSMCRQRDGKSVCPMLLSVHPYSC